MHPSVCAFRRIHLPLQGRLWRGLPPIKPLLQGEVSPQATEGCGTLPCEYPSGLAPGPPAGLADGWRLCVAARSRPQCRAGDFARRGGLAPPQGFRDDASIVPYGGRARLCRALSDISAANRQCTPPSAPCGASTSPCRGGFGGTAAYKASPVRGCGVERRLRRIQRDGAGAAVAERKCASAHAARCGHRKPVMSPQATEGCGTLPCEYPSGLGQGPPGGRERPPYNARHTGGETRNGAPPHASRPPPPS